ncbi:MAG: hypothetical protein IPM29_02570 [Planctomycetes bacterium]|nr:hypothetical protein [Planctomycetota bacterium]
MTVDWSSQLLSGQPNAGAATVLFWSPSTCTGSVYLGCAGTVDLNFAQGIEVLFDGITLPLFVLGANGTARQTFSVPNSWTPGILSLQGLILQPPGGCAWGFTLTAAFDL